LFLDDESRDILWIYQGQTVYFVAAARVIDAMDRSVDPCEDFYSFACGGWINKHPIPQSQGFWDQLSLVREELLENLRVLLEEPDKETDFKQVKMARAFYKICMDAGKSTR